MNIDFRKRLEELSTPVPSEMISVRVQSANAKSTVLLVYKDARVDINYLNKVFGQGGWTREHRRDPVTQGLYCRIGIWNPEIEQWVYVEDTGNPSKMEKNKGEVSDSMKRAGFNLGIGIQLYDFPMIRISGEHKYTSGWSIKYGTFNGSNKPCYVYVFDGFGKQMFAWKHKDFDQSDKTTYTPR